MSISDLPAVNASLNALSTVFLTLGYIFIKRQRKNAHRNCMIAAVVTSAVFLFFYVLHKILVRGVHTPFGGEGVIQTVYYVMLVSHILLAMTSDVATTCSQRRRKSRQDQRSKNRREIITSAGRRSPSARPRAVRHRSRGRSTTRSRDGRFAISPCCE